LFKVKDMIKRKKSIMFVPGNSFVTRNYLSTPFFDELLKLKESYNLDVYFAGIESNPVSRDIFDKVSSFLSNHDISLIPLVPERGFFKERFFWKIRQDFLHKSSVYRFNDINSFITHKRYRDITSNLKNLNHDYLWNTDVWPSYLGFPFPKSKKILNIFIKMMTMKLISGQNSIKKVFDKISPDIVFIGDSQTPISFTYSIYGLMHKSYVIGNVRTWDHLTKNGPVIPHLSEYWVWNNTMKDEMVKFHNVESDLINVVGSPQFDNYFNIKNLNSDSILESHGIKSDVNIILFGSNRFHRGIGEPSIAKHIAEKIKSSFYSKSNFQMVIRSHPMDQDFEKRFQSLKNYPFVKLLKTPNIDNFNPIQYKEDGYLMASLLEKSKMLICGQSTLAIDASCTNTPIINLAFEGQEDVPDLLSVSNRYFVNHYQDLLKTDGTKLVSNFQELDNQISNYIDNPNQYSEGRKKIKDQFAGDNKDLSSVRIFNRLKEILEN
tara:strand:+ start:1719 stop:3194 length:1476 start_codon:yes stop_codon:yes gene_type:complete